MRLLLSGLGLIFGIGLVAHAAEPKQPTVRECPIVADSVNSPDGGIEFRMLADSAHTACGWDAELHSRDWWPRRNWYNGMPSSKLPSKGDCEPDTLPNTDAWGRVYFDPVRGKGDKESPAEWRARTESGTLWGLREIARDTSRTMPRAVEYELWQDDTRVCQFLAMDDFEPSVSTAWVRGDTCIVAYQIAWIDTARHDGEWHEVTNHILRNGVPLNYEHCLDYTYFSNRPFFFFRRDGRWGWFYNGVETTGDYERLFLHACCEPGANSVHFEPDGFRVFALRDGMWYAVTASFAE